jgi:hypothetical protein
MADITLSFKIPDANVQRFKDAVDADPTPPAGAGYKEKGETIIIDALKQYVKKVEATAAVSALHAQYLADAEAAGNPVIPEDLIQVV